MTHGSRVAAAFTASRPAFVTIASRPLWDETQSQYSCFYPAVRQMRKIRIGQGALVRYCGDCAKMDLSGWGDTILCIAIGAFFIEPDEAAGSIQLVHEPLRAFALKNIVIDDAPSKPDRAVVATHGNGFCHCEKIRNFQFKIVSKQPAYDYSLNGQIKRISRP